MNIYLSILNFQRINSYIISFSFSSTYPIWIKYETVAAPALLSWFGNIITSLAIIEFTHFTHFSQKETIS